jgi:hypothetical protein
MNRFWKSGRARFAAAAAVALAVGLLASVGAVSYAARMVGLSSTTPTASQYAPSKVTICHHTHSKTNPFVTITVSERALPAHLRHGDTTGPCPPTNTTTSTTAQESAKHAGKKPKHSSHQAKPKKSHPAGQERSALRKSLKADVHGQGNEHGQGTGQASIESQAGTKGHGQGKGHANGHAKDHTSGAAHGQGHGNGQGQGYGQGAGNGNPGGGKEHKP